ncbi:uncharacterized protein PGTG_04523 [Puccinia graminis f. sp. tritici CRL 75-36-700-3]|uniref:Uncharacterized protein n=1 Tax=Puccinia graminis f. sp. tritici (strain CRL 75-36-700-3 / race SCCL) TaxID=418459 RepID=E3K2J8_PUCGT|nr:uncharacterized protein PGTG_04523 [Puccinia graminis f. sp. tritici CRL 75-36-700-3]EFP78567.2 hypothetical protein PGTG_04523 [Puccinia graminis f. sp. tritici CRL 75-36-700-3]
MSRIGYDLLGRENPPPGYHSASENWRIHGIGPEPTELRPQFISCTTKFKLYFPRKGNQCVYDELSSNGKFSYSIRAGSIGLQEFYNLVADECEKNRVGAGDIIRDAVASGSPRMDWWISLKLRTAPQFNKNAKPRPKINDESAFAAWMQVIIDSGADNTNSYLELVMENPAVAKKKAKTDQAARAYKLARQAAQDANASKRPAPGQDHPDQAPTAADFDTRNVLANKLLSIHQPNTKYERKLPVFIHPTKDNQYIPLTGAVLDIWATALEKSVDGVSLYSPPASIKFEKVSAAKRQRLDDDQPRRKYSPTSDSDSSVLIQPDDNLMRKYVEFVIKPEKRDAVLQILDQHDIVHPKLFKSKTITEEKMSKWGLSDGIVAQLRDNVSRFDKTPQ